MADEKEGTTQKNEGGDNVEGDKVTVDPDLAAQGPSYPATGNPQTQKDATEDEGDE